MGQYWITVNFTKCEYINPHKIGHGLKFLEQCGPYYGTPHLLFMPLSGQNMGDGGGDCVQTPSAGRWQGDKIAVVGDCMDRVHAPELYKGLKLKTRSLCQYAQDEFTDVTDDVLDDYCLAFGLEIDKSEDGWRGVKQVREV